MIILRVQRKRWLLAFICSRKFNSLRESIIKVADVEFRKKAIKNSELVLHFYVGMKAFILIFLKTSYHKIPADRNFNQTQIIGDQKQQTSSWN